MPEISPNTRRCLIMVRQRRVLVLDIFLCTYRLNTATQQVGTWMAVKVRGRLDALPPAFTRGVPPVRRPGGGGSTNSRQQSVKQNSLSVFAVLISHSFFERYTGDGLPPIPVCALVSPPSQVRGGKDAYRIGPRRSMMRRRTRYTPFIDTSRCCYKFTP